MGIVVLHAILLADLKVIKGKIAIEFLAAKLAHVFLIGEEVALMTNLGLAAKKMREAGILGIVAKCLFEKKDVVLLMIILFSEAKAKNCSP